jgi:acyl-CoA synthetase (NDP forming)
LDFRAAPADYAAAIGAALHADDIDGLMVVHAPGLPAAVGRPVDDIEAAAANAEKPVMAVLLATPDGPIKPGSAIPNFMFPEPAAAVLGRSWAYGQWLSTESAAPPAAVDADLERADELIATAVAEGAGRLDPIATADLLRAYGVGVPPTRYVAAAEAAAAATEIGFPVAVKARHRRVGRSVRAGVALDLVTAADVSSTVEVMRAALGDHADFVIVQAMVPPGLDLRIKARIGEEAGPLISTGIGGIQAGLVGDDDPVRLAPLSRQSAIGLVAESRAGPQLAHAGVDPTALVDALVRAAQLAADHAEITALDLNPVITSESGCAVTDAVVEVAPVARPAAALRRL